MLSSLRQDVKQIADAKKGQFLQRFFKTGEGDYGAGDVFCGLTVPQSRTIAQKYHELSLADTLSLLQSKIHEERLIALLIMVSKFQKGDDSIKEEMYEAYLKNTQHINNWDLVDLSADKIVGEYLKTHDRKILTQLARSKNIWERRISMIATFQLIKDLKEYKDTFTIADILLQDKHDLIQKAVGWMLREVGKRVSREKEEEFLKTRYRQMPRTMLRYAIEHFPEEKRKSYLKGEI